MSLRKWLRRRRWTKYLATLILAGGGGTAAWLGLIVDSKPKVTPVPEVVPSIVAISEVYGVYN